MPEAIRVAVFWATMVLFAIHVGLALAAAAVPLFTSLTGLRQVKRLKIFIDKFGQQASTFALLGGFWVFILLCAALAAIWFLFPDKRAFFLGIPLPLAALAGPVLLGAAAFLTYRGLWQSLKTKKGVHALLGTLATVLLWLAFYAWLAATRPLALDLPATTGPEFLLPGGDALIWRLLLQGITQSIALAGIFTGAWLVWRRNKDDFGRDYYNFTLRLTARVGFLGQIVSVLALGWLVMGLLPLVGEVSARLSIAIGLYGTGTLLSLLCLAVVLPQENALRNKLMLPLAAAATVMALTGLCAAVACVFLPGFLAPMP